MRLLKHSLKLLALVFGLALSCVSGALAVPAVDGGAGAICSMTGSCAVSLTTSVADDVIVILVHSELNSVSPTVSSVTATGLSFTKRIQQANGRNNIEMWTAQASGTLSSRSITVTFTGNIDNTGIIAFGVSGAASGSYMDAGGDLPKVAIAGSGAAPTMTITTSKANNLLIAWGGCSTVNCIASSGAFNATCNGANPQPSGYTKIGCTANGGGQNYDFQYAAYKQVTSIQSAVTTTQGATYQFGGEMAVAAITSDGGSSGAGGLNFLLLGAGR